MMTFKSKENIKIKKYWRRAFGEGENNEKCFIINSFINFIN